jgi:hypothetical protein
MARVATNGAVIADSAEWYYTGSRWRPLVAKPVTNAPGFRSHDASEARKLAMGVPHLGSLGAELMALVAQHGSLEAAEATMAGPESKAMTASPTAAPPRPLRGPPQV